MISFRCRYCGKKLGAKESSAGKEKTCPNCRARVRVPAPGDEGLGAGGSGLTAETGTQRQGTDPQPRTAADHPLLFMPKSVEYRDLIDMTAMVDIVFFLLIFFLVTSMQSIEAVIGLPAPEAPASAPDAVQAATELTNDSNYVLVTIDADDAMWVEDDQALSENDLRTKLRSARQKNDRSRMMIKCAPESTHGTFVSVLDAGADAGMTEIQFSVTRPEDSAKAG